MLISLGLTNRKLSRVIATARGIDRQDKRNISSWQAGLDPCRSMRITEPLRLLTLQGCPQHPQIFRTYVKSHPMNHDTIHLDTQLAQPDT